MKINFEKELRDNTVFILIFLITNITMYGIRSSLNNTFSFSIYDVSFFKKQLITISSILIVKYLFIFLKSNKKINVFFKENCFIESTLSYISLSLIKRIIISIIKKQNMFNIIWLRNIGIIIGCSLFMNSTLKPFIPYIPYYKTVIDLIQNIFITFMLDYFIDLKLDNPKNLGLSGLRTIISDIIEFPIKNFIHSNTYSKPINT